MTQRHIHCVGLSDEDTAHVRLLLRVVRKELRDPWAWGSEARADLIVVNQRRLAGDSSRRRAQQRGVACAQVLEPEDAKPAGPFLRKPLRREALVALLNQVGGGAIAVVDDDLDDPFADMDLGFVDLSQLEADYPGRQDAFVAGTTQRGELLAVVAPASPAGVIPDYSVLPTARAPEREAAKVADAAVPAAEDGGRATTDASQDPFPALRIEIPNIADDATFPLSEYIAKNLLRGPARIAMQHSQPLVLDPERQMFLAHGSLRALEPYARQPLRFGDWHRIDDELESMRRLMSSRPLAMLAWLERYLRSGGFLPRHVDAGGTFRLAKRLELGDDYARATRVAGYMGQPRKLHEIARLSGVDLDEVFNVVSAYEAIGYMEWTRRDA